METNNANTNANGEGSANNLEGMINASDLGLQNTSDADKQKQADLDAANKAAADKAEADRLAALNNSGEGNGEGDGEGAKPTVVEIDGIDYTLDAEGNAVKDGQVFKTKAELDTLGNADNSNETSFIEEYAKLTGVTPLNAEGQPIVYEDTEEGLIAYNKDVVAIQIQKGIEELYNADKDVKALFEHKRRGGSTEDFIKKVNSSWSRIQFDGNNEDLLKNAVIAEALSKGMSKERAELTANMYKDTNKLKEFGKEAFDNLVKDEKFIEQQEIQSRKAFELQEEENNTKHWNNVKEIVTKGKLNNIVIPESDRDNFFKYMALPVDKDRNSQSALDVLTEEQLLQLEYLKFKKFDLSKLITAAVKNEKVKGLRARLTTEKGAGGGEGIDKGQFKKFDDSNISLDSVLRGTSKTN